MPLGQLRERLLAMMQADDRTLLPAGETWASLLASALQRTMAWLRQELGDDPQGWRVGAASPRPGTRLSPSSRLWPSG